jgi:hypothetical protein
LTSKQLPKPTVQAWPITSIDGEEQSSSTIFPHPLQSGEQGIISLKKAGGIGRIYDMKGVLVDNIIMQDAQVQIGPYASGAYVFVHHAEDGSVIATHPFIIQ